jgi:hypothetical protein
MSNETGMPIREMGISFLKEEIGLIKDTEVKDFTERALSIVPEKFFYIPASSSGKYHPSYANGIGGLLKHSKAAVKIAAHLFTIHDFTSIEQDYIVCALILHDCAKPEWEHPLLAAEILKPLKKTHKKIYNNVTRLIASHMGQWNKAKWDPKNKTEFPLPEEPDEDFVHLCDYLASRKDIDFQVN